MKLTLIRLSLKLGRPVYRVLEDWLSRLEWAEIVNTPVGPNPHPEGTLDYYLHEESNRLRAAHRIHRRVQDTNPRLEIFNNDKP